MADGMDHSRLVENGSAIVKAIGHWPSFHDAIVLEAAREAERFTVAIHIFVMTDRVDPAGYYILEKHHLVRLVMHGVQSNTLPPDYTADGLYDLTFRKTDDFLEIEFDSHTDRGGTVVCVGAHVVSVVPCSAQGVPLALDDAFKPDPPRGPA